MMLQLPADVLQLIAEYIPNHQRAFRLTFRRMRLILPVEKLPGVITDLGPLCESGDLELLKLYPEKWFLGLTHQTKDDYGFFGYYHYDEKGQGFSYLAAKYGHLELLKWLISEQGPLRERPLFLRWNQSTVNVAAKKKHFDVVKWALENGCLVDWQTHYYLARHNNVELLRQLLIKPIDSLRDAFGIKPVQSESSNEIAKIREGIFSGAAQAGHLNIFQEFRSLISRWKSSWVENAAEGNHLDLVKWLSSQGCRVNEIDTASVARAGHMDMLIWLKEHGCIFDVNTTAAAAAGGHLGCLQWLREQNCPWNERVCYKATKWRRLEMLKWARENGCPWDRDNCLYIAGTSDRELVDWIQSQPE